MICIFLTNFFEKVALLSLMGSMAGVGILLIKMIFGQKLSAKLHYCIWFILLLRLVIPFSIPSPFSVMNFMPKHVYPQAGPNKQVQKVVGSAKGAELVSSQTTGLAVYNDSAPVKENKTLAFWLNFSVASWIWFIGVVAVLAYFFAVNLYFSHRMKKYVHCETGDVIEVLKECKALLKIDNRVRILYDDTFRPPMVLGIINPRILLSPELVNQLSHEEVRLILLHELAHIKRKDLPVNLVMVLIKAVYWFNPIIWYLLHRMKQDCEMACDATVLSVLKQEDNRRYGSTVIRMMEMISEVHWAPSTIGFANKYNKRRITMIAFFKKTSMKSTAAALLAVLLLTGYSSLNSVAVENKKVDGEKPLSLVAMTNQESAVRESSSKLIGRTSIKPFIGLLGMNRKMVIKTLKENPVVIDEGGLEFKKTGIRVWFDKDARVSQVFTQRQDVLMKGAKISDKINRFKKAFGNPISSKKDEMHFRVQKGVVLAVNYDGKTEVTYAVYVLRQ